MDIQKIKRGWRHEDSKGLSKMLNHIVINPNLDSYKDEVIIFVKEILESNSMNLVDVIDTLKNVDFLENLIKDFYQIKDFENSTALLFIDDYIKDSYIYNAEPRGEVKNWFLFSARYNGIRKFQTKEDALSFFKSMFFFDGFYSKDERVKFLENNLVDNGMNAISIGYEYLGESGKIQGSVDVLSNRFLELNDIKLGRELDKNWNVEFDYGDFFIHISDYSEGGWYGNIYHSKKDYLIEEEDLSIDGGWCVDDDFNVDTDDPKDDVRGIEGVLFFKDMVEVLMGKKK